MQQLHVLDEVVGEAVYDLLDSDSTWGVLEGDRLTVNDPAEAVEELRDDADYRVTQSDGHGDPWVRPLRALADQIEAVATRSV